MKTLKLTLIALACSATAFAQKNNVQSASTLCGKNRFADAKEYIDLAHTNETTSNDPKMWYLRGRVYLELFRDTTTRAEHATGLEISMESAINSIKTDTKEKYKGKVMDVLINTSFLAYDEAAKAYTAQDYEKAITYFDLAASAIPYDEEKILKRNNINESSVILYSGYASNELGKSKEAMAYFQKLVDMSAADPALFITMSRTNQTMGDTAAAIEIVRVGRERFETNNDLIKEELALYEMTGRTDELLAKLTEAIEYDPSNELLRKVRAQLYEGMREYDKAEADYKAVLEYDEYNFDANYAVGAMFFNAGVAYNNDANALSFKETTKIDALNKKAEGEFKRALPYLEKALEVKQDDLGTLQALKQLYVRFGQTDKYKEVKELIDAAKQ